MSEPRLLHMGGAVVDFVYRADGFPAAGAEVVAEDFAMVAGGGFNMMVAAARSGLRVAFGGSHGAGPHGDFVRQAMLEAGIEILQPPDPARDTGNCVVLVTPDGERSFLSWPGAEGHLRDADLASVRPRAGDHVFVSGYTLSYPHSRDALLRWLDALDGSVPVVFDPAPVVESIPPDLLGLVLARTNWLSANASEMRSITGLDDVHAQLRALLDGLCPQATGVVVRSGARGAWLGLPGREPLHVPSFDVRAVDTNGAGDTHLGAFVAALARGEEPASALGYANAAAAISVTRRGGSSAPTAAEVETFILSREPATV